MQENNNFTLIKNPVCEGIDISDDYTLPDYIADVRKLVRMDAKCVLRNIFANASSLIYEGEVIYSVLVICEDDTIKNIIYSEDFSVNSGYSGNMERSLIHSCKIDNSNARLLSERKINCRSRVVVSSTETCEYDTTPILSGDGMPEAQFTVEKQLNECNCMYVSGHKENNLRASHDIEIPTDREEIANVVYCDVNCIPSEQVISDGKLTIKGETKVDLLYETVNSDYRQCTFKFPFSEILEPQNLMSTYICDISVRDIKATVRNNSFGEMRLIELDYSYNIECRGYSNRSTELVTDIYSTAYDMKCEAEELTSHCLKSVFSGGLSVNEIKSVNDIAEENITEVVLCNGYIMNFDLRNDSQRNKIVISGDIKFDLIFKCEDNEKNKYCLVSLVQPYKYEREGENITHELYKEHFARLTSASAVLDRERLILNAELHFNVMVAEIQKHKYVCSGEFSESDNINTAPITVYYPGENDNLWDVAKKYRSTCSDIKSINSLKSDSLEGIKVILLPKKKKKAVFNKVIQ